MNNRKGIEMAVSTVILIIIGIAVLIGLLLLVMKGFDFFKGGTEPILETQEIEAVRQACNILCSAGNEFSWCCKKFDLNGVNVSCIDKSFNSNCRIDCSKVVCN
ncbi:MAG: hypothetical protein AABX96_05040 [Nanoarchaeota archaeon]